MCSQYSQLVAVYICFFHQFQSLVVLLLNSMLFTVVLDHIPYTKQINLVTFDHKRSWRIKRIFTV